MKIYIVDCKEWSVENEISSIGDRRWSGTLWDGLFSYA